MPVIIVLVPETVQDENLKALRHKIRIALEKEGVPMNIVTVEFSTCRCPERLVINYYSRSEHLIKSEGRLNHEAAIVGRVVENLIRMNVECIVHYCDKKYTGLYLTDHIKNKSDACEVHGSIEYMQSVDGLCPGCRKP